jgi:hypothetical protein
MCKVLGNRIRDFHQALIDSKTPKDQNDTLADTLDDTLDGAKN